MVETLLSFSIASLNPLFGLCRKHNDSLVLPQPVNATELFPTTLTELLEELLKFVSYWVKLRFSLHVFYYSSEIFPLAMILLYYSVSSLWP